MKTFKKFSSIENSTRKLFIDQLMEYPDVIWVAQEKVHGSNFGIWTDGKEFKASKRSNFVEGNSFYNAERILNENLESTKAIFNELKNENPHIKSIHIFGEICGGSYPNASHTTTWEPKQVQKEIKYSPNQEFIVFDIRLDISEENITWIDIDKLEQLCEKHNMLYTPILFKGKLKDMLELNPEFHSTLYKFISEKKDLKLNEIPNNWSEGFVLKPNKFFKIGQTRAILKHKSIRFTEKIKTTEKKEDKTLTSEENEVLNELTQYINENRLRNVLSKIGTVTSEDFGKILKHFNLDILEDWKKETDKPEFENNKNITKQLSTLSAQLIRKNFVNILDNNF